MNDRNAPCPCGSGRKAKKCCLELAPAPPPPASWEEERDLLLTRLAQQIEASFDDDVLLEAVEEYVPLPLSRDPGSDGWRVWIASRWVPHDDVPLPAGWRRGESAAQRLLRKDKALTPRQRTLLEAMVREPASWWLVEADPEREGGFVITDLFRGQRRLARVADLGRMVGRIVHGRFIELDGTCIGLDIAPGSLPGSEASRAERIIAELPVAPSGDELVRGAERLLRLSFITRILEGEEPRTPRLTWLHVEASDVGRVLAQLATGFEADPVQAAEALDAGRLRWRAVDEATGQPGRDLARVLRRGDRLELTDLGDWAALERAIPGLTRQLEGTGAVGRRAEETLASVLDGIVGEPEPIPERALVKRLLDHHREAWGDARLVELIGDGTEAHGHVLPLPEVTALHAFSRILSSAPRFTPGDEVPSGWRVGETAVSHARRHGRLTGDEVEALHAIADAEVAAWRVVEMHEGGGASVRAVRAPGEPGAGAVLALDGAPPLPEGLRAGDVIVGLSARSEGAGPLRLIVAARTSAAAEVAFGAPRRPGALPRRLAWLCEIVEEAAHDRMNECIPCAEVYRVGSAEAAVSVLQEMEREQDDEASDADRVHVHSVRVERNGEGAFEATAELDDVLDDLDIDVEGHLRIRGDELRIEAGDAESLSQWREDIPPRLLRATSVQWLRQERG